MYLGMNVYIFQKWGHKVTGFDQPWTTGRHWYVAFIINNSYLALQKTLHSNDRLCMCTCRLDRYAASTARRGSPVTDLVGWVDGTYVQGKQAYLIFVVFSPYTQLFLFVVQFHFYFGSCPACNPAKGTLLWAQGV